MAKVTKLYNDVVSSKTTERSGNVKNRYGLSRSPYRDVSYVCKGLAIYMFVENVKRIIPKDGRDTFSFVSAQTTFSHTINDNEATDFADLRTAIDARLTLRGNGSATTAVTITTTTTTTTPSNKWIGVEYNDGRQKMRATDYYQHNTFYYKQ